MDNEVAQPPLERALILELWSSPILYKFLLQSSGAVAWMDGASKRKEQYKTEGTAVC